MNMTSLDASLTSPRGSREARRPVAPFSGGSACGCIHANDVLPDPRLA